MFPFQVSPRPRERQLVHRRMREILDEIERLERAGQGPAANGSGGQGESNARTLGFASDSRLEELRSQLPALMHHALELVEEIAGQEPLRPEQHREPATPFPIADLGAPTPAPAASWGWTEGADGTGEIRELRPERQPDAGEYPAREIRTERESEGISIRVIPPRLDDARGDGATVDLTLVFDLGPRQAPVRVSLPIERPLREHGDQRSLRETPERREAPERKNPMSVALIGVAAIAFVVMALALLSTVWAGSPRAATATSQAEQAAAEAMAAPTPVPGPSRALREQPTTRAAVLTSIPIGTRVEVLDGAEFADGFHWLRVRMADGKVGWVASAVQGAAGGDKEASSIESAPPN